MLGSSGTVTTLAGVNLALPRYIRALVDGSMLTFDQIEIVSRHLAGLDIEGRAANPCVGRERADLVLSGCAILDAICSTWPVGRLRVADRGIREGILFDLMHGAMAGRLKSGEPVPTSTAATGSRRPVLLAAYAAVEARSARRRSRPRPNGWRGSSTIPLSPRRSGSAIARAPPSS